MYNIIENSLFLIPILFMGIFLILTWLATKLTNAVLKKESINGSDRVFNGPMVPGVSLIIPIHNSNLEVIDTISSLFKLQYSKYEIILVNDGSTDDTLALLIKAFDLQEIPIYFNQQIPTKKVKGIYQSKNSYVDKLILIDKEEGGISDALNVGINASKYPLFGQLPSSCILDKTALSKMAKAYLDNSQGQILAISSAKYLLPHQKEKKGSKRNIFLEYCEVLDYSRFFLTNRIPSFKKTGIFSNLGSFSLFDKKTVLLGGGYDTELKDGESELMVRLLKYVHQLNGQAKIKYLHTPVCWKKASKSLGQLFDEQSANTSATILTIWKHKHLLFNTNYGYLGVFNYPFWFFQKMLLPLLLVIGTLYLGLAYMLENISLTAILFLFTTAYLCKGLYSSIAVIFEDQTTGIYRNYYGTFKLLLTAIFIPLLAVPLNLWIKIRAFAELILAEESEEQEFEQEYAANFVESKTATNEYSNEEETNTSSSEMLRKESPRWWSKLFLGINEYIERDIIKATRKQRHQATSETDTLVKGDSYDFIKFRLMEGLQRYFSLSFAFLFLLLLVRSFEFLSIHHSENMVALNSRYEFIGACYDILFMGKVTLVGVLPFLFIYTFKPRAAINLFRLSAITISFFYFTLVEYFVKHLVPLGTEWLNYSKGDYAELLATASSMEIPNYLLFVLVFCFSTILFLILDKIKLPKLLMFPFYSLLIISFLTANSIAPTPDNYKDNMVYYLINNKFEFFIKQNQ